MGTPRKPNATWDNHTQSFLEKGKLVGQTCIITTHCTISCFCFMLLQVCEQVILKNNVFCNLLCKWIVYVNLRLSQVPPMQRYFGRGLWSLGHHQMKLVRTYGVGFVNQGLLVEEGHWMYVQHHHQHKEHCWPWQCWHWWLCQCLWLSGMLEKVHKGLQHWICMVHVVFFIWFANNDNAVHNKVENREIFW